MPDSTASDEDSDASDTPSLLGRDDESGVSSDGSYQRASRQLQHELFGQDGIDVHDVPSFIDVPAEEEGETERQGNILITYKIGDFMKSNYYQKLLHPQVREKTYQISRNQKSSFRSRFFVPLTVVDNLTDLLYERGSITETNRVKGVRLYARTQLLILCSLEHLGGRKPFVQFKEDTEMREWMHMCFFKDDVFLPTLYSMRDQFIRLPPDMDSLQGVLDIYMRVGLPGCGDSIDVVHCIVNGQHVLPVIASRPRARRSSLL